MTETKWTTDTAVPAGCTETGERMHWNEAAHKYTHAGPCSRGREHRHLELTIHPPIPQNPWPDGECMRRQSDPWWLASVEWDHARSLERDAWIEKLLSAPVLAAEYWKSLWEYDTRLPDPDAPGWHLDPDGDVILEHEVLFRFARLPHAASSEYQ